MKRSLQIAEQRQKRKRKIYPTEYRVPYNKKERNSKDLTEAGEIKKRWQEYTENLYKMSLLLK